MENHAAGWILTLGSSVACVLGASVVFVDALLARRKAGYSILGNQAFMSCSLGLSVGVMLCSSLYVLLPASLESLSQVEPFAAHAVVTTFGFFAVGTFVTLLLNKLISICTPHAVHHCGDDAEEAQETEPLLGRGDAHHSDIYGIDGQVDANRPIKRHSDSQSDYIVRIHSKKLLRKTGSERIKHSKCFVCATYEPTTGDLVYCGTAAEAAEFAKDPLTRKCVKCVKRNRAFQYDQRPSDLESPPSTAQPTSSVTPSTQHTPHPTARTRSTFFTMGLQTAVAICMHKFPEGLITFVSTAASRSLGLSVFVSIAIHNLTEGFMIALPLYAALHSRTKAFFLSAGMGGLSQPIGALIGYSLLRRTKETPKEDQEWQGILFGVCFGVVSGMMFSVVATGLGPQAWKCTERKWVIVACTLVGAATVIASETLAEMP